MDIGIGRENGFDEVFPTPKNIMHHRIQTNGWIDYLMTSEGIMYLTFVSIIALLIFRFIGPYDSKTIEYREEMRELWQQHERRLPGRDPNRTYSVQAAPAKPLKPPPKLNRETIWVDAGLKWRVTKVTKKQKDTEPVEGEVGDAPASKNYFRTIVTLHDLGHNHRSCYGSFTSLLMGDDFFEDTVIYHIDFPGHEESAVKYKRSSNSDKEILGKGVAAPYTLDNLAVQLEQVLKELKVAYFLAVGTGIGANVWVRYASAHPRTVQSLLLIGINAGKCTTREWTTLQALRIALDKDGISDHAKEGLAGMSFSQSAAPMIKSYYAFLDSLNPEEMRKLVLAALERKAIDVDQLEGLKKIPILLAGGNNATGAFLMPFIDRLCGIMELQEKLPKEHTEFVHVGNCGHIITEEKPEKLLVSLKLFLEAYS